MATGLSLFGADRFGRRSVPGLHQVVTASRERRWASGQKKFFHRTPNGAHDPLTHYHVLITLLSVKPNERFTSRELTRLLQTHDNALSWDPVTVGRVLMDLHDSIQLAHGEGYNAEPIITSRKWSGNQYYVSDSPEAREILARLADDLYELCEQTIASEAAGERQSRLASPLTELPSLHGTRAA